MIPALGLFCEAPLICTFIHVLLTSEMQSYVAAHWNEHGRPDLGTIMHKVFNLDPINFIIQFICSNFHHKYFATSTYLDEGTWILLVDQFVLFCLRLGKENLTLRTGWNLMLLPLEQYALILSIIYIFLSDTEDAFTCAFEVDV